MKNKFRWIGQSENQVVLVKRNELMINTFTPGVSDGKEINVAVIDLETTGLNHQTDEIIELAITVVSVNSNGEITKIIGQYNEFNEPISNEISEFISGKTGITFDMVSGKKIDWAIVESLLGESHCCISFNAAFDRPFLDKMSEKSKRKPWGDAYSQIPWESYNFPKSNLESLCYYHGFYYDAHRADADVISLINLLQNKEPISEKETYFSILLGTIQDKSYIIVAKKTPFAKKDVLRNYRMVWNQDLVVWYKFSYSLVEVSSMAEDINQNVFDNKLGSVEIVELDSQKRFKDINYYIKTGLINANSSNKTNKPWVIIAEKTPYDTKNMLRDHGYEWSNKRKYWYKYIETNELEAEKEWLAKSVYPSNEFDGKILENSYYKG